MHVYLRRCRNFCFYSLILSLVKLILSKFKQLLFAKVYTFLFTLLLITPEIDKLLNIQHFLCFDLSEIDLPREQGNLHSWAPENRVVCAFNQCLITFWFVHAWKMHFIFGRWIFLAAGRIMFCKFIGVITHVSVVLKGVLALALTLSLLKPIKYNKQWWYIDLLSPLINHGF